MIPFPVEMKPYHTGKGRTSRRVDHERREFIAWDGEGVNLDGVGKPQSYVLFGSNKDCVINPDGLSTFECLDHILETGKRYPQATHVGFAFTYDANMIINSLTPSTLARLHKHGYVRVKRKSTGDTYVMTFARGKFFRVSRYGERYDRKNNPHDKVSVQIFRHILILHVLVHQGI